MGRRLRSKSEQPVDHQPVAAPQQGWAVTEVLRIRCPVCGMLAKEEAFQEGPHAVQVLLQRFGGSFPSLDGANKKKRGFMEYADDWPNQPAELAKWRDILHRKLHEAIEEFGEK